MKQEANLL